MRLDASAHRRSDLVRVHRPVGWPRATTPLWARWNDDLGQRYTLSLELEDAPRLVQPSPEVLAENRFLAARDGMDARLIDPVARQLIPVREMLDSLLRDCRPHALALGCADTLDRVQRLAASNGAERQRGFVIPNAGLDELVVSLADQFLAPRSRAATEERNGHTSDNPTERSGPCAAGSHTLAPPFS